ncbi:glycosyl hydrolase [Trinickia symbiotica]|uniref:Glycosyl hydrolase n=1 Tax=Trinickia symbiotica TaxID=863227 RepID=A0A2T3XQU3_9BURK|nr:glycosyl hydrolase [Trinickia symbiotica]
MMRRICLNAALLALALAVAEPSLAAFADPIDTPAAANPRAGTAPLLAVAHAGSRLVAVGLRGLIVLSDDNGASWRQAPAPVSSDLVAVYFASPSSGWATGQDGIVLHTADGGASWVKQLDGRSAAALMLAYYEKQDPSNPKIAAALEEAKRFVNDGPGRPFLSVWFDNERTGYIIGSFNVIFRTDDGGASWTPWFDRTENEQDALNLHAIRRIGSTLYIVGEQGLVMRFDAAAQQFVKLTVPYKGSFFGIFGTPEDMILYGLRGNALRSVDGGQTWTKVGIPDESSLLGGVRLADGRLALLGQDGRILVSTDGGANFSAADVPGPPWSLWDGTSLERGGLVAVGSGGVKNIAVLK